MKPVKPWKMFQREANEVYFRALLARSASMSEAARLAQMDRKNLYVKLEQLNIPARPTGRKSVPFIEREVYK